MLAQSRHTSDPSVAQAQRDANNLSRMQKAAIIIALLGAEDAKPLINAIEERHMRAFVTAMQSINLVPRNVILATVADFVADMSARNGSFRGGEKKARELAASLLDTDRANKLFKSAPPVISGNDKVAKIWEKLGEKSAADIADYLNTQRPEVINIVLSNLSPAKAGEILGELSDDAAETGGYLMAEGSGADADTLAAIAEVIEIEMLTEEVGEENTDSASFMSDVMGVLPRGRRDRLMEIIEEKNPEQAERIRRGMLTFEDLPTRLPKTAIPIIFRDMDNKLLLQALKAGDESDPMTVGFLYGNISQRMAEQYKEDVGALGAMSEKEGEAAVISLMTFISSLEKAGTIAYIEATEETSMADFEMDMNLEPMSEDEAE